MSKDTDRRIAVATAKLKDKGWYADVLKAAGPKNAAAIKAAAARGSKSAS